jgi:hypothetical protein
MIFPASSRPPGPTAITSPSEGFSLAVSGIMISACGLILGVDARNYHMVVKRPKLHINLPKRLFIELSDEKRSPRSQDECRPFLLIGVLLALVKCDCQVVGGGSGAMLLTPWIQTNINSRGCHNRAAIKKSDFKDLEILVTTQIFRSRLRDTA